MPPGFEALNVGDPREIGGYRLYARLGAGGMGQVYLSFLPSGRPVALKVVRPEFADDPEFRSRFAAEARAAQRVNGVQIAPLLDAGPDARPPWLATAYVPGPTLDQVVRAGGRLAPAVVLGVLAGVAAALREVHAAGVVHRDLKPANVILSDDGPRVIDFGVARAADATTASVLGVRVGSPQYMAPEQVRGETATPASDVFALGALGYYAATGRPAFGEGSDVGVAYRIVHDDPPLAGCPPELLDLVRSCLAKDPADRPTPEQVIAACRTDGLVPAPEQWLPPEVLREIRARSEAVTALAGQSPPPPAPADPVSGARRSRRLLVGLLIVAMLAGAGAGAAVTASVLGTGPDAGLASEPSGTPTPDPPASQPPDSVAGSPSPPAGNGDTTPQLATVQYHGEVRFDTNGIDLDPVPPTVRMDWPAFDADLSRTSASATGPINAGDSVPDPNLALWPGPETPTREQCADQVATHGAERVHIPVGQTGCLYTSEGRVAMITITDYPDDSFEVTAEVTVWSDVDS